MQPKAGVLLCSMTQNQLLADPQLAQAAQHAGLFMLGVSDTDVWGSPLKHPASAEPTRGVTVTLGCRF